MNKYKILQKRVVSQIVIAAIVLAAFTGVLFGAMMFEDSKEKTKEAAEAAYSADVAQTNSLQNQIDTSGTAEKRFYEIQGGRNNLEFAFNKEQLKEWLRNERILYRFAVGFKLNGTLGSEAVQTAEPDLKGTDYNIGLYPDTKLDFQAISDVHVFSFLDDLMRQPPGIVRIDHFDIKRVADLDTSNISNLQNGYPVNAVEAHVTFTWIGVSPKASAPAANANPNANAPGAR